MGAAVPLREPGLGDSRQLLLEVAKEDGGVVGNHHDRLLDGAPGDIGGSVDELSAIQLPGARDAEQGGGGGGGVAGGVFEGEVREVLGKGMGAVGEG